uniref:Uncharacterized protein n=1 Tax=Rhizophora mucronata TaxID=61149 RepID=A0A2P2J9A9_RHIMU
MFFVSCQSGIDFLYIGFSIGPVQTMEIFSFLETRWGGLQAQILRSYNLCHTDAATIRQNLWRDALVSTTQCLPYRKVAFELPIRVPTSSSNQ